MDADGRRQWEQTLVLLLIFVIAWASTIAVIVALFWK
jgi:hypothetical protein